MKKLTMFSAIMCFSIVLFAVPAHAQYGVQQMGDTTFIYNYNTGQTYTVQNLPGSGPPPTQYQQPQLNLTFPDYPGMDQAAQRANQMELQNQMMKQEMRRRRGY